ncbi:hypothetical protein S7711_09126 [Stachybotrys chartarum IBT 7711]|uniref:Mid2 domain-containing protein n=1 Tax=Stachybotrys chartarum (strain CBS 109288 / IBT 7711) TaxID=1280523 RepID=A0A084B7R1_STACB|nr:hypothetical protein S7711_09126 [Stachybotrys chartarum IBT 7711]
MRWFSSGICAIATICLTVVAQNDRVIDCYGINGLAYANNTRCPGSNACCGVDDECLSNRLCHRANDGPGTFVRGPCAINPYDSGTCGQICLYNETGILPRVRACADGSLCCDNDERCCDNGDGIFLGNDGVITDSAPSTTYTWGPERTASTFRMTTESPSTSEAPTSTEPSTSSVATTSSEPQDGAAGNNGDENTDDGSTLAIGLGVGLGVGIPLIAVGLGLWFFCRKRKRAAASSTHELPSGQQTGYQPTEQAEKYRYAGHTGQAPHEVHSPDANVIGKAELATAPPPVELDGNTTRW